MYRLLLTAVMVVGVLSGFVQGGTTAYYTSAVSTSSRFTAGTVELTQSVTSGSFVISDLTPGDSITIEVKIENSGDVSLRYAMTIPSTTATGANLIFFNALDAVVWDRAQSSGSCANTPGGILHSGSLGQASFGLTPAGGGSNANRLLDAGVSEYLCFKVTLPDTEGVAHQGATADVTYTFKAFQAAGTSATGDP